jgi:hypothetical protein
MKGKSAETPDKDERGILLCNKNNWKTAESVSILERDTIAILNVSRRSKTSITWEGPECFFRRTKDFTWLKNLSPTDS